MIDRHLTTIVRIASEKDRGTAALPYPVRVELERAIFACAQQAAAATGHALTGFSETERARLSSGVVPADDPDVEILRLAFVLRDLLAVIASGDPYVTHEYGDIFLEGRAEAIDCLRRELVEFVRRHGEHVARAAT